MEFEDRRFEYLRIKTSRNQKHQDQESQEYPSSRTLYNNIMSSAIVLERGLGLGISGGTMRNKFGGGLFTTHQRRIEYLY